MDTADVVAPIKEALSTLDGISDVPESTIFPNAPKTPDQVAEIQQKENERLGSKGLSRKAKYDAKRMEHALQMERERAFYAQNASQQMAMQMQNLQAELLEQKNNNLELQELTAKDILHRAKIEGDAELETMATDILAEVKAKKINTAQQPLPYLAPNMYQPQPYGYPQYPNQPYNYNPVPTNQHFEEWKERNPWADPEDRANYNPQLALEAFQISQQIEKNYILQGQKDRVGSPEFLKEVDRAMHNRYSPNQNNQGNNNSPYVSPVQRNPNPDGGTNQQNNGPISLTPEERKLALSLNYMTDMTDEQKLVRFAKAKMNPLNRG